MLHTPIGPDGEKTFLILSEISQKELSKWVECHEDSLSNLVTWWNPDSSQFLQLVYKSSTYMFYTIIDAHCYKTVSQYYSCWTAMLELLHQELFYFRSHDITSATNNLACSFKCCECVCQIIGKHIKNFLSQALAHGKATRWGRNCGVA